MTRFHHVVWGVSLANIHKRSHKGATVGRFRHQAKHRARKDPVKGLTWRNDQFASVQVEDVDRPDGTEPVAA